MLFFSMYIIISSLHTNNVFFFSSRRRHTRWTGDWSSDVCSSDLNPLTKGIPVVVLTGMAQKNAARLRADGAAGFLEKSSLELEKGSERLLTAVREILSPAAEQARKTTA